VTTWQQAKNSDNIMTYCFAVSSNGNIFAGVINAGVLLSTDNGASWNLAGMGNIPVYSLAIIGSNLFAIVDSFENVNYSVCRSSDNGKSWTATHAGLPNGRFYALAVSGKNLFAGTDSGVYKSTDNGTSWNQCLTTSTAVYSLAASGSKIAAGTFWSGIFLSTNGGTSWKSLGSTFSTQIGIVWCSVTSLTFTEHGIIAGANGSILFTTNNGTSWIYEELWNSNTYPVQTFAISKEKIFAGADSNGVWQSSDDGASWTTLDSVDLLNHNVNALIISGIYLIAGTDSGIYRKQIDQVATGTAKDNGSAYQFELNQNYPNPFNPSTTINFSLQKSSLISLDVYNVQGKKVVTLMEGQRPAGSYTVTFDGSRLASGVYFCHLRAGSFTKSIKMILMK